MQYKSISSLIFFLVLNNSIAQSQITSKHLRVLNASEQSWSPGIVRQNTEPAGGKVYEIHIKVRKRGAYNFESLLVGNEKLDIEIAQNGERNLSNAFYKKCSKWQLIARSNQNDVKKITDESLTNMITENRDIDGWILYKFKGQTFAKSIAHFDLGSGMPNQ